MNVVIENKIDVHVCDESCETGQWIHSFLDGWQRLIECPLYHGHSNIRLFTVSKNDDALFSFRHGPYDGIHLNCEIPNMSFR